jgi:diaminohydroxyphosphoribosylaminopyrimidine deaminase/5-amino-6-(5-phosphoribosylamino)uracil reductase
MVGAVIVHEDRIIGEGYHMRYGEAHAEVIAINQAIELGNEQYLKESTIYVSLEPCSHFGKTPPCADLIIKHRISNVVIGCRDPFPEVNGKGIETLKHAGINVISGVLEEECKALNKQFFTFHEKKRPYIILKWAETANGMIGFANGNRLFITNELTNRLVHKWRSEVSGIMVGTNTALMDDPQLTNRFWPGKSPTRIVLDINLRLPPQLKLFDGSVQTIVLNAMKHSDTDNIQYLHIDKDNVLDSVMKSLYEKNIQSVMIEGGTVLLQSFIDSGLWDEARVIQNVELVIGEGVPSPKLKLACLVNKNVLKGDRVAFFGNKQLVNNGSHLL